MISLDMTRFILRRIKAAGSLGLGIFVVLNFLSLASLYAAEMPTPVAPGESPRFVTVTNLDTAFTQGAASCTLSSYAIVASYFTGKPVTEFFEGYCHNFHLFYVTPLQAERRYAAHFDGEFQRRNCRGIEVILDLHSNATEKCYAAARGIFDARFYLSTNEHIEELEKALKTSEAFLNVGYETKNDVHTVTVFYDGSRFLVRDTNWKGFYPVDSLKDIGSLVDSVLYVRRSSTSETGK